MQTTKTDSGEQFATSATPTRIIGWGLLLLLGIAFAVVAVLGVRPIEQLLAGGFAMILTAVSTRMLWPIFSLSGIRFEGAALFVLKKNAEPLNFRLPADVKKVHRFGADAKREMVVEVSARGKTFRLVTSQYKNAERLRRLLAELLKLESS